MNIADMIKKYDIFAEKVDGKMTGRMGIRNVKRLMKDGMKDTVQGMKPEILAYIKEEEEKEEAERARRKAAIAGIEGLEEIQNAIRDLGEWQIAFNKSFDHDGGLGVPAHPDHDIEALKGQYPRAAAYLKAEEKAHSANFRLSAIGRKALEEVIFGDYEKAMADMDEEIKKFVEKHMWD